VNGENGPFIDDFPIKTSIYKGFCMAELNNQMVYIYVYRRFLWVQAWPWSTPHATAEFPAGRMWIVSLGEALAIRGEIN
jgi:hypothetical protein